MGAFFSKLSTRNAFFNKICSLIWLPYAFRSGISFRQLDKDTFTAKLPFRRFNRNWYNAMAGAALLGNSEVAAGMYLFAECGSDYVVICKEMRYRFLSKPGLISPHRSFRKVGRAWKAASCMRVVMISI